MYDEKDRPLSEVRLFMESCYGFLARFVGSKLIDALSLIVLQRENVQEEI